MSKYLAALFALVLTGCATQIGARDSADQRLTMFSQVVFAPDYDSRRVEYLAKWVGPINITLKDRDTSFVEKHKGLVKSQMKSLEDLTSLPIKVVTETQPSNVTIYFESLAGIKQFTQTYAREKTAGANIDASGCHSEIDRNARHEITKARIFIRAERDVSGTLSTPSNPAREANKANRERVNRCVSLEMIRILGLRNSSDIVTPSIFNSTRYLDQTTVLDNKFIRTLYQPELKVGALRLDALKIADGLLQK